MVWDPGLSPCGAGSDVSVDLSYLTEMENVDKDSRYGRIRRPGLEMAHIDIPLFHILHSQAAT